MIRRIDFVQLGGIESISVRSLAAASSIRSIALSGRNRSAIYRLLSTAAATSARVLDPHAVMQFVALAQTAQNRNRVFDARLIDQTPVWKRRSSAASFSMCLRYSSSVVAPMQCSSPRASIGLSRLPASIEPSAFARADHRVQLVDEKNDLAFRCLHFFQHRLQAFLEFAAELRAGDQRAHVER